MATHSTFTSLVAGSFTIVLSDSEDEPEASTALSLPMQLPYANTACKGRDRQSVLNGRFVLVKSQRGSGYGKIVS